MKIVRLQNNRVAEIFPTETYEKGIAYWYNEAYAAASVEAPDDVEEGMVYDPATGAFSPAPIPATPLTLESLAEENRLLKAQVEALSQQNDFHEELIVELAMEVYA